MDKKKKKKKNLITFISSLSLNAGSGHRGKRDRFKSETRIRSPKQNNKIYFLFVSQENKNYGEVHRKLATHGSDALWEDDLRPAHHPRRVRSLSRLLPRWTWPPSIPWRKLLLTQIRLSLFINFCFFIRFLVLAAFFVFLAEEIKNGNEMEV